MHRLIDLPDRELTYDEFSLGGVSVYLVQTGRCTEVGGRFRRYHRITEWFGLEGIFRGHPVQPPGNEQAHLPLDYVAQSPIQPDLECFQGWGIYHLSGQPIPVPHHPHRKKFLPNI